jgi:hypothetical protein
MGGAEEQGGRCAALFLMSFLRHEKIYRSDVGLGHTESRRCGLPPALIGLDEFPVGYSLAGCSPADPASASPTGEHCAVNSSRRSKTFHRTANSVLTVCLISGGRSTASLSRIAGRLGTRLDCLFHSLIIGSSSFSSMAATLFAVFGCVPCIILALRTFRLFLMVQNRECKRQ